MVTSNHHSPPTQLDELLKKCLQFARTSLLRPPSKIPSPAKALSEISESVGNSRATAMLPPQSTISLKHKTSARMEFPHPRFFLQLVRITDSVSLWHYSI